MINHPNRSQKHLIRLSLTRDELEALVDVLSFAQRQGYHPMSVNAAVYENAGGMPGLRDKVEASWRALTS